jgi:hypothetical protein
MPPRLVRYLPLPFFFLPFIFSAQVDEFVFESAKTGLKPAEVKILLDARPRLLQEQYAEASALLETIGVKDQLFLNYLLGICYSHDVDHREEGLKFIRAAGPVSAEINGYNYHLAYALMKNDSNETAITYYNKSLEIQEKKKEKNQTFINDIKLSIEHCRNIIEFKAKANLVKISNLGPPVNTNAHEYCPLVPSNEEFMIYTYRGPKAKGGKQKIKGSKLRNIDDVELYFEDIFISEKINDTLWAEPRGVNNLNTGSHDAAVAVSADGSQLIIYKNRGKGKGDLYISKVTSGGWGKPDYQMKLNSPEWDGSACFLPNQNTVIFSSERKGGSGGKDLYSAELIGENTWGNIKNLGAAVNTKYDEDAPFVTSDGKILFFSSNNKLSLGGYDIFRSDFMNGEWLSPYNLGPPINTLNDDNYYIVRGDGKVGYYSSYKKGGDGGQDIYKVEPGIPGKPVKILQVDGLVTIDGKPAPANVEIRALKNFKGTSYKVAANKTTGHFLCNLPAGEEYEMEVNAERFPPQVIALNALAIDSFVVLNVYADFTSPSFDEDASKDLATEVKAAAADSAFEKAGFGTKFGTQRVDSVYYTVQIAAYKFAKNFNYNALVGLPKVEKKVGKDKVNRFTIGRFDTYNEAHDLLLNIRESVKDAFITAVYKGERKMMSELIEEKILK